MKRVLRRLAGVLLSGMFAAGLSAQTAAPDSGRLTREIEGVRYTFAPADEPVVRELAPRVAALLRAPAEGSADAPRSLARFSSADLRAHRADYLQRIATNIGLAGPTELQAECYDGFLENFERTDRIFSLLVARMTELFAVRAITLYRKDDLVRRLQAGEKIPGATLDADGRGGRFDFNPSLGGQDDQLRDLLVQRDRGRLDHGYNFSLKDGVVDLSGYTKMRAGPSAAPPAAKAATSAPAPGGAPPVPAGTPLESLPLVIGPELENLPPAKIAEETAKFVATFVGAPREIAASTFQQPVMLAWLIFHETTELGIVERYLGSRDRRWFCEGVANYVAWKIARDAAGPELARQVYDLPGQLAQHAPLRPKVDLAGWPTADRQREADRNSPENRAHYTFATRAVALMIERHGEDFLPRLFTEIGRTPRAKANMRTVAQAYRQLAREDLDAVLSAALKPPAAPKAGK